MESPEVDCYRGSDFLSCESRKSFCRLLPTPNFFLSFRKKEGDLFPADAVKVFCSTDIKLAVGDGRRGIAKFLQIILRHLLECFWICFENCGEPLVIGCINSTFRKNQGR